MKLLRKAALVAAVVCGLSVPAVAAPDVRGTWTGFFSAPATAEQSFTITEQKPDGQISGFGSAAGFSWTIVGQVTETSILMEWPYKKLDYTVTLSGTVDGKGTSMSAGEWADDRSHAGTWTAVRSGTQDRLTVLGKVKGGPKLQKTRLALIRHKANGKTSVAQQVEVDTAGKYEFIVDTEGTFSVATKSDYCVVGKVPCTNETDTFDFTDSGDGERLKLRFNFAYE
jgi:hypothetical protein